MIKKLQKIIGVIISTAFVVAIFFCLNSASLDHTSSSNEACCAPATSHTSSQEGHALDHLQHWQQMFKVNVTPEDGLALGLSLLGFSLALSLFFLRTDRSDYFFDTIDSRLHKLRNLTAKLFDTILQALSSGILNPKLYN